MLILNAFLRVWVKLLLAHCKKSVGIKLLRTVIAITPFRAIASVRINVDQMRDHEDNDRYHS